MAHAAPAPVRAHRPTGSTTWLAPLLAVAYGLWAAANHRDGGPITTGNVLYGIVAGVVFGAVYFGLRSMSARLPRELRALAWGSFTGIAFGFLYSLTDASILRSIGNAAIVGAVVAGAMFYRYYTTEDAKGHHD
ncbi:hypothetical protein RCO28_34810 [Streptomyces sp. LHD-70]|uniref:hypothetical protein n=1 Tax=Streptomyces sp. LHD-70 TaxID=3072140 RepID=UPI00280FB681|nr:hypothetical protein [Streptomyces sp. LHD-70]MDQ8707606.1 hypothetical protein [Streptomyces sp. LHD-70]